MIASLSRRGLFHTTALAGALAVSLTATAVYAQDAQPRAYNIPAQSLAESLRAYGMVSGEQIIFAERMVSGRQAPALQGTFKTDDALKILLADSGLTATRSDTGGIMIRSASDPQSGSAAGDGAEGTVQALIVTAQKREENIQDVPIAMSAFTQEDLTRSQVAGGPDLMTQVPNMTFTKTNFSSYSIQIRGIGTQAISATIDPAVAVAFNNTPFLRNHFFEQEFFDLERVEVLRGPQGTLYGRNATAGVVNLISAKPKYHFEAKASADISNYSSSRLEGMINLPLVEDKAALRVAGEWTKRDGFVKNTLTGKQTDGRDLWSARATLRFEPTDWLRADLIYEHFAENDDRLRSGKQLCHTDPGPLEIGGIPVPQGIGYHQIGPGPAWYSQGCKPASLYSPDSFQTPNGYMLPYYSPAASLGSPVYQDLDPYMSRFQSRNLREIETQIDPEYTARNDVVELQMEFALPSNLTLVSETGANRDYIYSSEDYNRFATARGVFVPGGLVDGLPRYDLVDQQGVFCDPQLGCSDRLLAADLDTATSRQFSQEFRLSSNFDGPFNFSGGGNFIRYKTKEKYYVFVNTISSYAALDSNPWVPGVSDNVDLCFRGRGRAWSSPNVPYGHRCLYMDPNDMHHVNDEGRNYFLSINPYHLTSYSVFGEAYYQIAANLKLTAGFRWTYDHKVAPQLPTWIVRGGTYGLALRKVIDQTWREPTGRLALDWKPHLAFTDQTLVYVSYVRGYKAGGANPPPPVGFPTENFMPGNRLGGTAAVPERYGPEFVNSYELGTKNTLLNGKLTFNLNGFYYDYTGYQISQIVDRTAVNLNFDAKVWGSELEVDWRPIDNLQLGLKSGYEGTRLAKGSKDIDTMDRTAGDPNYVLMTPNPADPGNCIVPLWYATNYGQGLVGNPCRQIIQNIDPYPATHVHLDPATVPNYGVGILKDISGNVLPNAPHWTATITADYTVPLPSDWLMTLHTDLYYQSEAWTRVFNTPGYDKLKAYNNINVAAIFSNEDRGWQVMAYVKNVLDKDNITGAFLNSDDTGLTTNVFLNEPRLYGLRVTRSWSDSGWWNVRHARGAPYTFRVETEGYYGRFGHDHAYMVPPYSLLYPADFQFPFHAQNTLAPGGGGGVKLTYAPDPKGWNFSAGIRYGRAGGTGAAHGQKSIDPFCWHLDQPSYGIHVVQCTQPSGDGTPVTVPPNEIYVIPKRRYEYTETTTESNETHAMADFMVGKEVGLGSLAPRHSPSTVSFGLSYAQFKSTTRAVMFGMPDLHWDAEFDALDPHPHSFMHRFSDHLFTDREFNGLGPSLQWDGSIGLMGDPEASGGIGVDVGLGGAVLFGRQKTVVRGTMKGEYAQGKVSPTKYEVSQYNTTIDVSRSKAVSTPVLRANLGLSYTLQGIKVSGGYKMERYYNAIDGGYMERKSYDRTFDGPYFKVSVGFGG